jgi:hypothetical protein
MFTEFIFPYSTKQILLNAEHTASGVCTLNDHGCIYIHLLATTK